MIPTHLMILLMVYFVVENYYYAVNFKDKKKSNQMKE